MVKGKMENALEKSFRSYGKHDRLASVMISVDTKSTSDSAKIFLLKKISMIKEGELSLSPQALDYVDKRLMEDSRQIYDPHKWTKPVKLEKD